MKYLYRMGTTNIIVLCDFNEFGVMAIIIANFFEHLQCFEQLLCSVAYTELSQSSL